MKVETHIIDLSLSLTNGKNHEKFFNNIFC